MIKLHRYDPGLIGALAARSWDTARSIKGTLAERYLVNVCGVDIEQITVSMMFCGSMATSCSR